MVKQIAWIDVESTGLDPVKNDVVQIALLVEEDGKIIETANIKMRPNYGGMISGKALKMNHKTIEEIGQYSAPCEGLYEFKKILQTYVHPRHKYDKFIIAGYNIKFDVEMLNQAFLKNGDKYFFSWFFSCFLDVQSTVAEYILAEDTTLENYKLKTVCSHFGIKFKAHDAMEDIKATRELYYTLKNAVPA